jgi:hypothetical protein
LRDERRHKILLSLLAEVTAKLTEPPNI